MCHISETAPSTRDNKTYDKLIAYSYRGLAEAGEHDHKREEVEVGSHKVEQVEESGLSRCTCQDCVHTGSWLMSAQP